MLHRSTTTLLLQRNRRRMTTPLLRLPLQIQRLLGNRTEELVHLLQTDAFGFGDEEPPTPDHILAHRLVVFEVGGLGLT